MTAQTHPDQHHILSRNSLQDPKQLLTHTYRRDKDQDMMQSDEGRKDLHLSQHQP